MSDKPVEAPAPAADTNSVDATAEVTTATQTEAIPTAVEVATVVEPAKAPAATEVAPESTTAAVETPAAPTVTAEKAELDQTAAEAASESEIATEAPAATSTAVTKTAAPAVEETPKPTPIEELYAAARENGHPEIWGVTLADPATDVPSQIVFQKYLNANDGDLVKAKDQLLKTLDWRAKTKPLELLKETYNSEKFAGLGYVTHYTVSETYDPAEPETREVFTWNIYGSTRSIDKTFGDLNEFLDWRIALMELALQELSLSTATKAINADYDPYKIYQVHDYKSISFLRQSSHVKAASTETIKVFAQNYPELLKEKFFVNVPAIMGFLYSFIKLFVAPKTSKKFHPMSNGAGLAREFGGGKFKDLGERLPTEYGGKAGELKTTGKEPLLTAVAEEPVSEVPAKGEAPAAEEAHVKEEAAAK